MIANASFFAVNDSYFFSVDTSSYDSDVVAVLLVHI